MAKHIGPKRKYLRRFGLLPSDSSTKRLKAKSEYGQRLEEKQKLKFLYNVTETQFRRYVASARKSKSDHGELVLEQLERRLDNVVFRAGFAKTREQSRQLVSHAHILVNDKKLNIPSYEVKTGDKIVLKEKMFSNQSIQEALKERKSEDVPGWIERKDNSALIRHLPESADLPKDIDMGLILGFYR